MIPSARTAYMEASVQTASPARLLVMLYERLVLDCRRALTAQQAGDHLEAHTQLVHAQEIVIELRSSLKVDDWEGGPALASLYDYLQTRLVNANVQRDAATTEHCLELVTGLADAWREAALQSSAAQATAVGA
jgi:flagellar protein FliS